MRLLSLVGLSCLLTFVASTPEAAAKAAKPAKSTTPTAAPATTDRARARSHYEQGIVHYNLSEFDLALAEFKNAYRLDPRPVLLFNVAQCYRKMGDLTEALTFYRRYLSEPELQNRPEAERNVAQIEQQLALAAKQTAPKSNNATSAGAAPADAQRSSKASRASLDNDAEATSPSLEKSAEQLREPTPFEIFVRTDVDVAEPAALAVVGAAYSFATWLDVGLALRIGGKSVGPQITATAFVLSGAWRPFVFVAGGALFRDGAQASGTGGLGLRWNMSSHWAASIAGGVEYFPSITDEFESTYVMALAAAHYRF